MDKNFDIFVSGNYPLLPIYLSNKEGWQPVSKNSDYYYEKTPKNSEYYYEKTKDQQDDYYQDYEDYNSIYYDWPTTKSPPKSYGFNRYFVSNLLDIDNERTGTAIFLSKIFAFYSIIHTFGLIVAMISFLNPQILLMPQQPLM